MEYSEQALGLIRRFEGLSLKPYMCPAGKRTIGYGHVLSEGETVLPDGVSEAQAEEWLQADAARAAEVIHRCIHVELCQYQFDALTSFIFNVGAQAFAGSTLLKMINRGRHKEAVKQFGRWVYGGGKVLPGLVARREAEARMYKGVG